MISAFKQLFAAETEAEQQNSLPLAALVLMFEVSRADGDIDQSEIESLSDYARQHLNVDEQELTAIIDEARRSSDEAISLQKFTQQICSAWDNQQRKSLLSYCWQVALADAHLDVHERHVIRKIAALLYLNEREIQSAKIEAQTRFG